MSNQATSTDLSNVTFSQGLEDGLTHSDWLASPMKDQFGQDRVLAKPCQSQEQGVESKIQSDTFGPLFDTSSPTPSADLCAFLESKLRAALDVNGSPEYALTWRQWDMPQGPQICALRASARRTSGSDCGGWPTAQARDYKDTPGMSETGTNPDGSERSRLDQLPRVAALTTPEQSGGPAAMEKQGEFLPDGSQTAGYPTPQEDNANNSMGHKGTAFSDLPTTAMDAFKMPDMTGWKLNPGFSGWLMGYPKAWMEAGLRAMQNCSRSRKASKGGSDCSKATETQ